MGGGRRGRVERMERNGVFLTYIGSGQASIRRCRGVAAG